jgi:hypothetical protein
MPSPRVRRLYQEARQAGYRPAEAIHAARTLLKWRAAWRMDLVELLCLDDDGFTPHEGNCCCDDPQCSAKTGPAFGVVGQFRQVETDEWTNADSIWGCTGYVDPADWRENPYVIDIMAETMAELSRAIKSRTFSQEFLPHA